MSGFETAQLIKSRERTRYIPIIFLTAISKEEDYVFRGYQVGAVDYISKPFQPDVLRVFFVERFDVPYREAVINGPRPTGRRER